MKKTIAAICAFSAITASVLCSCEMAKNISDAAKAVKESYDEIYGNKVTPVSSYSENFKNKDFLSSLAECFGKDSKDLTEEDVLSVRYISMGPDEFGKNVLYIGLEDYETVYFSEKYESAEEKIEALIPVVKQSYLEEDGNTDYSDLALFKNVSVFELYETPVADVSFIKNYTNLAYGYFSDNGITDISSLADFRPESLKCLDFTGNDITDWSALMDISDIIVTNYRYKEEGDHVTFLSDLLNTDTNIQPDIEENVTEQQPQPELVGEETIIDTDLDENEKIHFEPENDVDWSVLYGE